MPEKESPRIIIDEDWKSRVQAEKEAAQRESEQAEEAEAKTPASESAADETSATEPPSIERPSRGESAVDDPALPPASFDVLVSMFTTQALLALGLIPDPSQQEGRPAVQWNLARHSIDMLAMLEEKTKGNLEPEEERALTHVLHELRMAFVDAGKSRR